jgi:hypothetical protein
MINIRRIDGAITLTTGKSTWCLHDRIGASVAELDLVPVVLHFPDSFAAALDVQVVAVLYGTARGIAVDTYSLCIGTVVCSVEA